MKKKIRIGLSVFAVIIICGVCFVGVSYLMLSSSGATVDTPLEFIPYGNTVPSVMSVLLRFEDGGSIFCEFNTEITKTSVILLHNSADNDDLQPYGYRAEHIIDSNYSALVGLIDNIGGVDMGDYHYTGIQITEILRYTTDLDVKRDIASAVFNKISVVGFSNRTLVDLIEASSTDFSFPDGYPLLSFMPAMCKNVEFIN